MNYRIVHRTTYDYSEPVTVSHHAARLKPRSLAHQQRLVQEIGQAQAAPPIQVAL